jgi:tRNA modification GTPase
MSHHLYMGSVSDPGTSGSSASREVLDQVLFCLMRGPCSFTGEDVIEIHAHGGAVNLQRILEATQHAGAVQAEPGEFTRRAFLRGKLDLTRAEATAALIGANSARTARQAQRQLAGELGKNTDLLRRTLLALLGRVEATLDFPELEAEGDDGSTMAEAIRGVLCEVSNLADGYQQLGKGLESGLQVAVFGRPNVGKSSLINALCQSERVVVDRAPGTTRDYVEVQTEWEGIRVTLVDTVGERVDAGRVEQQGLRLGRRRWRKADLLFFVVDGCCGLLPEEAQLLETLPADTSRLLIWNKLDALSCKRPDPALGEVIQCSALCGWGLAALREMALKIMVPQARGEEGLVVLNSRQAQHLVNAAASLRQAHEEALQQRQDLVAAGLRFSVSELGKITGDETSPDMLDSIFSQFCIGK